MSKRTMVIAVFSCVLFGGCGKKEEVAPPEASGKSWVKDHMNGGGIPAAEKERMKKEAEKK